jgi:hypothetical protein
MDMNSSSGKLPEGGSPEVASSGEPSLKAMDAEKIMASAATTEAAEGLPLPR